MEFLELLQSAQEFIPPEYTSVSQAIDGAYPYFYLAISAIICFFGLKVHHIWLSFFFFMVGFLTGCFSCLFFPQTWSIYIFIAFGLVLGVLLARCTHKLYKLQLFILNAYLVFSALPRLLEVFFTPETALALGGIAAILAGILAVKLKYILVIVTTATMGATRVIAALLYVLGVENQVLALGATILLAALGMCLQFLLHRREEAHHEAHKQHADQGEAA